VIRTIARRKGLGSLITTAGGMGAILGFVFTLDLLSILGFDVVMTTDQMPSLFPAILTIALFETALGLAIILAAASVVERRFKSYTIGFYWSFVAIVLIELILTILGQPAKLIQ